MIITTIKNELAEIDLQDEDIDSLENCIINIINDECVKQINIKKIVHVGIWLENKKNTRAIMLYMFNKTYNKEGLVRGMIELDYTNFLKGIINKIKENK